MTCQISIQTANFKGIKMLFAVLLSVTNVYNNYVTSIKSIQHLPTDNPSTDAQVQT